MNVAPAPIRDAEVASSGPSTHWQILTGEYPPQPGGVSDYTRLVAQALAAAGDRVDVWAPPCAAKSENLDGRLAVRRLPDHFGPRSLRVLDREIDALPEPRRLLVQYVPHAFGWKAVNVPFCLWLYSRRRDSVWIMFHEVAYPVGADHGVAENTLGAVTRWMAALTARAAERIFVSIPAWQPVVESLGGTKAPISWLPVPSSVPDLDDPAGSTLIRRRIAHDRPLVGHLGTYGRLISSMVDASLPALLTTTNCHVLLLGRGGDGFRNQLLTKHPAFLDRVSAPGVLSQEDLSRHVHACDIMLQPYPDGVSSRRTSVMVALSHGRPVVTTIGRLSESVWRDRGAVVLVPADNPSGVTEATVRLLSDPIRRAELSGRARQMYAEQFDLSHTIGRLHSVVEA